MADSNTPKVEKEIEEKRSASDPQQALKEASIPDVRNEPRLPGKVVDVIKAQLHEEAAQQTLHLSHRGSLQAHPLNLPHRNVALGSEALHFTPVHLEHGNRAFQPVNLENLHLHSGGNLYSQPSYAPAASRFKKTKMDEGIEKFIKNLFAILLVPFKFGTRHSERARKSPRKSPKL